MRSDQERAQRPRPWLPCRLAAWRHKRLAVFPGNELGRIANMMHDTELDIGLREGRFHGIPQTGQSIAAQDEYVEHAARFQIIQNREPETSAFGFFNPEAEHLLLAGEADAQDGVHAFFEDTFLGTSSARPPGSLRPKAAIASLIKSKTIYTENVTAPASIVSHNPWEISQEARDSNFSTAPTPVVGVKRKNRAARAA